MPNRAWWSGRRACTLAAFVLSNTAGTPLAVHAQAAAPNPATGAAVRAGTRLIYYSSAASVRGSREEAVLDPNCDASKRDCWIDPGSGQTYGNREVPTASGQGLTQVDILLVSAGTCVGRIWSFGHDATSGRLVPNGIAAFATSGSCGDYWQSPAALRVRGTINTPATKVLRGPLTIDGRRVEAVSIGTYGRGSGTQHTYDAATGLLQQSSSRATGNAMSSISQSGQWQSGAGNTALSYSKLLESRVIATNTTVPPMPAEVARVQQLSYRCQQQMQMPGTPGMAIPCQLQLTVTQRGTGWMLASAVRQTANVGGVPTTDQWETVITPAGPGGHWLSPQLLATYSTGQVLDRDARTGITTRVAQADARGVLIVFEWPGEQHRYWYDRNTGWLNGLVTQSQMGAMTMTTAYELAAVR